ncbi:ferric reductase-like transmembrane domain-containing protein [Actinomycetes bacterium M1A6_2h]
MTTLLSAAPETGRSRARTVLTVIALVGVLVVAWPVLLWALGRGPVAVSPLIAHATGMAAGYGVLVMMTLMSRWPVLENGFGSDLLTRWHSRGGRIVLTLVLVHAWAAVDSWASSRHTSLPAALWQVLGMPWLICATLATAMLVAVAVVSIGMARRRLRYERWHGIHLLAYVAVALSFLHQLGGPDLAGRTALQMLWALVYTHTFGLMLRYRIVRPIQNAMRYRLRVQYVIPESPNTVSIVMSGRHLDELRAQSGQFFRWRFLTPDTWVTAHPFSLSAPPRDNSFRITVKSLGDGSSVLQSVDVGTWVIAEGPYGAMTSARRTRRNVVLIAGGVGITPMRALFESLAIGPGESVTLLYRARTAADLVFRAELEGLAYTRGASVQYLLGPSRDELSTASLLARVPDLVDSDVYLCGPPGMAEATRDALGSAGLPSNRIHEERF